MGTFCSLFTEPWLPEASDQLRSARQRGMQEFKNTEGARSRINLFFVANHAEGFCPLVFGEESSGFLSDGEAATVYKVSRDFAELGGLFDTEDDEDDEELYATRPGAERPLHSEHLRKQDEVNDMLPAIPSNLRSQM